ncbi:MAG: ABC transporter substrate-binding protein [Candidatus Marinimicrobia bacterium]|nr:ABC transporter substrate-binding protein [Candidatus Neomarinimicrobiota bacterium]
MKISRRALIYQMCLPGLVFILLFSCQKNRQKQFEHSDLYPKNKQVEDGGTLVVGIRAEPESLNPLFALSQSSRNIIGLIFSRLADINEDLKSFSPRLAKSWEISTDNLQITFHLRTDVQWQDGTLFTSKDVVFTYQMHVNPVIAWDGIAFKQNISSVEAPNDSTAVFSFYQNSRSMLMDAVEGYIVPGHILQSVSPEDLFTADFNRHPIGTGPFRFSSWIDMQTIMLIKNDSYFESGKPQLDRIIFRIIPDNFNLLNQLKAGEIDMVEGIYPKDFQSIMQNWEMGRSNIRPVTYLGRRYDFIGWNMIDPESYGSALDAKASPNAIKNDIKPNALFGNQEVRAALTMALDRAAIMNAVNFGMAVPLNGPVPPILPSYNEAANVTWDYNPKMAIDILSEQGWVDSDGDNILDRNGVPFEFELLTESGNLRWEQVATIVQAQLAEIGIRATPRFLEPALLYGKLLPAKDFDAVIIGWSVGLTPDFSPLFHSATFFTPFHFTGYYSPEYDRLDELSKTAISADEAQEYFDKIARLLSNDLPYTWLYYRLECSAVHSRFKDIIYDKRGIYINPEDWWIPQNERLHIDKVFQK